MVLSEAMARGSILALALVLLIPANAGGQEPAWLLYQRGLERMDAGEYGEALAIFSDISSGGSEMPEVELAIGDIYRLEGEPELAERHYDRAYEQRARFEVPEDTYTALFRLADLFWMTGQYARMEEKLTQVLEQDPGYLEDVFRRDREVMRSTFIREGLDRVLTLYRIDPVPATRAHSRLAWYYLGTGRVMDGAIDHALFSVVAILTTAMKEYTRSVPSYRFHGVSPFLALAERKREILEFLKESSLAADLYNLGAALLALGDQDGAVQVWRVLTRSALEGRYRNLADRQIVDPRPEPALPLQ